MGEESHVLLSSSCTGLPSFSYPSTGTQSEVQRPRLQVLSLVLAKPHLGSLGYPQGNVSASSTDTCGVMYVGFVLPHIQKLA